MPEPPEDPFDDPTLTVGGVGGTGGASGGGGGGDDPGAAGPDGGGRDFHARFEFRDPLGKGGMGEVYLALDGTLRREVAVKLLRGGRAGDAAAVERFLREARVTARLDHPNVVPVHALERTAQGEPALVMKRVRGVDFKEYLARCRAALADGSFHPDEHGLRVRVEHFLKACDAIVYAHDQGVVHRDLKPANLMLGPFHEVYLMDWGIAQVSGEEPLPRSAARAEGTTVTGTPAYMAPEQAREDGGATGPAADQYALGMLLQEMLTLRPPRQGGTVTALVDAAARAERAPCVAMDDAEPVPRELQAIIAKACAPEPQERYPSVAAFAHDLRRWQRNESVSALPDRWHRKLWRHAQNRPGRAMGVILGIVLVAAAVTTASLLHVVRTEEQALARGRTLTGLVERLSGHLLEQETTVGRIREAVARLQADVEVELRFAPRQADFRFLRPSAFAPGAEDAPEDLAYDPRYEQPVSFTRAAAFFAPGGDPEAMRADEERLAALTDSLPRTQRASAGLQYAYVGLESGLMVSYPGLSSWPEDYDPRRRPWYEETVAETGVHVGAPFPDAFGAAYMLPVTAAARAPDGALLGVAGISVRLDVVMGSLFVPGGAPHETLLVDREGGVLMRRGEDADVPAMAELNEDSKPVVPLSVPPVIAALQAGDANGAVEHAGKLYVYARSAALDLYLVQVFDARRVFDESVR